MKIGIVELFKDERIFPDDRLLQLGIETLEIPPLGEIFHLDYVGSIKKTGNNPKLELLRVKSEKSLHTICAVNKEVCPMSMGLVEDTDSFVYTIMDPKTLAHELGHNLGLKHPSLECTFPVFYDTCQIKNRCSYFGYLMCADFEYWEKGFHEDELKILRKYIGR